MRVNSFNLEKNTDIDFGSGRIETRVCYVLKDLRFIESVHEWKGIKTVVMIHAKREFSHKTEE